MGITFVVALCILNLVGGKSRKTVVSRMASQNTSSKVTLGYRLLAIVFHQYVTSL